jgi:hypothetical protein
MNHILKKKYEKILVGFLFDREIETKEKIQKAQQFGIEYFYKLIRIFYPKIHG